MKSASIDTPASDSLLMSTFHPVSFAASRAFCPRRPMARESLLSGTTTRALLLESLISTRDTSAGQSELPIKTLGSSLHSIRSIFSSSNSATIAWTRTPLTPTQVPTASIASSLAVTATFERLPGSRAIATISTCPSKISGTSCSNNPLIRFLCVRETITGAPRLASRTCKMRHCSRLPRS